MLKYEIFWNNFVDLSLLIKNLYRYTIFVQEEKS